MIIYISGPISSVDFQGDRFYDAECYLKASFHDCIILNPYSIPKGLKQEAYMDISLAQVRACDLVYVLHGYENSEGCLTEIHYAKKLGKKIIYQS